MREVREHKSAEARELVRPNNQEVSFSGGPETYLREIKQHQDKKMSLERKANMLEAAIRRGKEPQSRMSEVMRLRREASAEAREVERAKEHMRDSLRSFKGRLDSQPLKPSLRGGLAGREITPREGLAEREMTSSSIENKFSRIITPRVCMPHRRFHDMRFYHKPAYIERELKHIEKPQLRMSELMRMRRNTARDIREISSAKKRLTTPFRNFEGHLGSQPLKPSFRGGLGGREIVKINADGKFSAARGKEQRAYELRSKAERVAWSGNHGKAGALRSEASRLLNQATALRADGQRILSILQSRKSTYKFPF